MFVENFKLNTAELGIDKLVLTPRDTMGKYSTPFPCLVSSNTTHYMT